MLFIGDDSLCCLLKKYIYIRYYGIFALFDLIAEHLDQWYN